MPNHYEHLIEKEVTRAATVDEVHEIGRALDAALEGLATSGFGKEEVILAAMVCAESVAIISQIRGVRQIDHDAFLAPVLDKIVPRCPDGNPTDSPSFDAVRIA